MAISRDSFLGDWSIIEWYPDPEQGLSEWLVPKGATLNIKAAGESACILRWRDESESLCTITPPLTFSNGELRGGPSHIDVTDHPKIFLKGAGAAFGKDPKQPRLTVSLTGGFVDGDPGTFIAEAHPGEEEESNGAG